MTPRVLPLCALTAAALLTLSACAAAQDETDAAPSAPESVSDPASAGAAASGPQTQRPSPEAAPDTEPSSPADVPAVGPDAQPPASAAPAVTAEPAVPAPDPDAVPEATTAPTPAADPTAPVGEDTPTPPEAAPGACPASSLTGSLSPVDAGMGAVHHQLVLTNTGTQPCTLAGFPGVSYVDAQGRQVGSSADRVGDSGLAVTIAPRESAGAPLEERGVQTRGQTCHPQDVAGLLVYPPNATQPLTVAHPGQACGNPKAGQLSVKGFGG